MKFLTILSLAATLSFSAHAAQTAGNWRMGVEAQGPSEVHRFAEITNHHGHRLRLSHYMNSDEMFATFILPKQQFGAFKAEKGLLFRVDNGEVMRSDEYSNLLHELEFGTYQVKIPFYFRDRELTNPGAQKIDIRWVDDSGNEQISTFRVKGYERALPYVQRDYRHMSHMYDQKF